MALWCKCDQVLKAITDLRLELIDKMNRSTSDNDNKECKMLDPLIISLIVLLVGLMYVVFMIFYRKVKKSRHPLTQVGQRIKKKKVTSDSNSQASDDSPKETKKPFLDKGLVIIKQEPMDEESASADKGAGKGLQTADEKKTLLRNLDLAEQNKIPINPYDTEQNNTNASSLSSMDRRLMDECNKNTIIAATTSTIDASDTTATTSPLQQSSSQVQWYLLGVDLKDETSQKPIDQQAKATVNSEATKPIEEPKE